MNSEHQVLDDQQLLALYHEDVPFGDLTTTSLALEQSSGQITFSARYDMCCSGIEEAERLLQLKGLTTERYVSSGNQVKAGTLLLSGAGSSKMALALWKITQNLMEWSGGIATAASSLVNAAKQENPDIHVACTRKNTPGTKAMSLKAVRNGGATIHRCGLSESILIFAEHCQFTNAEPEELLKRARSNSPELNRTAEVDSIEQAILWAKAGVEILQLEKFSPEKVQQCKQALLALGLTPLIGAAGGINAANAAEYATSGADLLITSWPYQARPKDIQVRFHPNENPHG